MRVGLWGRGREEIIKEMNTFPLLVYISPCTVDLSVITPTKIVYVTVHIGSVQINQYELD